MRCFNCKKNFNYEKFDVKVILPPNSLLKPEIDGIGVGVIEVPGIAEKSLDFKAINMELIVRMMLPIEPMISPLIVSCLLFIVILPFSFKVQFT